MSPKEESEQTRGTNNLLRKDRGTSQKKRVSKKERHLLPIGHKRDK